MGSRAFEIIETLVEATGDLVTKDDLMKRVWPALRRGQHYSGSHLRDPQGAGPGSGLLRTVGVGAMAAWRLGDRHDETADECGMSASAGADSRAQPLLPTFRSRPRPLSAARRPFKQLLDLLSAYRAVTLTGPGGIGKTVLASEVARSVLPAIRGRRRFVELVSLSDPESRAVDGRPRRSMCDFQAMRFRRRCSRKRSARICLWSSTIASTLWTPRRGWRRPS